MTTIREAIAEAEACAEGIKDRIERAKAALVGREAYLVSGCRKYEGRLGKIDNVISDEREGILVLLMLYRADRKEFLNSDGESRSYRSLSNLMVVS